uniref:Uncharacterized protein n=1 Tax=Anguilla anguilla TaxID=7936 RepID=A0A0E9QLK5_ANGAN
MDHSFGILSKIYMQQLMSSYCTQSIIMMLVTESHYHC